MYRFDGVIPSPPDHRDFPARAFLPTTSYPESFDLPDVPRKDQGPYGMCVDFSLTGMAEVMKLEEEGALTPLGNGYLYGNRGPDDYKGEGMYPREAMASFLKGIPEKSAYHVVGDYPTCASYYAAHKAAGDASAYPQRIKSYVRCTTVGEVKGALYNLHSPVAIVIVVTPRFASWIPATGKVMVETKETLDKEGLGLHQMFIRGYMTDAEGTWYHVVNSWGNGWGVDGECYIRADDPRILELWAVTDVNPIGRTVTLRIDDPVYTVVVKGDDGNESVEIKTSDVAPFVKDDRTFLPVRAIAEVLGCTVKWDEAARTVTVMQMK